MKYITIAILFFCPFTFNISWADEYKEYNIFIGVGAHSEKYDCPEVCYGGDALAIIEVTWKPSKYTAIKGMHISNPTIKEKGLGTNAGFIGFDYSF